MVKTEETAHGRRVEKRRGGEGGGGVVLVPHAGGANSKYDGSTSSVLHLKLSVLAYVSNVQTLMHCVNEAENYHPRAACALRV